MTMTPSEQALLTEYQVCQDSRNEQTTAFWAFAGIFLGLSVTALGFLAPQIFRAHCTEFNTFLTVIGIGVILIYILILVYLRHINAINGVYTCRMRQIEHLTGMVVMHNRSSVCGPGGTFVMRMMVVILSVFWIVAIVIAWS